MVPVVGNSYFIEHSLHALHGLGVIAASSDPGGKIETTAVW